MNYQCSFCAQIVSTALRCKRCGYIACEPCTKGGKSSTAGGITRAVFGVLTYGISEAVRAGYRSVIQKCPACEGKDLVLISG
jgi:hypothetical protein